MKIAGRGADQAEAGDSPAFILPARLNTTAINAAAIGSKIICAIYNKEIIVEEFGSFIIR
jgi:hypothetical protein